MTTVHVANLNTRILSSFNKTTKNYPTIEQFNAAKIKSVGKEYLGEIIEVNPNGSDCYSVGFENLDDSLWVSLSSDTETILSVLEIDVERINRSTSYGNGRSDDSWTCLLYTSPSPRDRG